jgi:hypothetical protein
MLRGSYATIFHLHTPKRRKPVRAAWTSYAELGRISLEGPAADLIGNEAVRRNYLGT